MVSLVAPIELTTFVGRRQELAEGRRMLRAAQLVTLVGPGGVGKTRLGVRLGQRVRRLFRHGVVLVELASQSDSASLPSEVAAALDVDPQGQPAGEAVAEYLRSRELLLVLDNCEHLLDACAQLVTNLLEAAPRLRVLATSREPLRVVGEHLMDVEPLALPTQEETASGAVGHVDAVALLTERARAVDPGFRVDASNAADASRLCRRLDGIPLAIELAAARLRVLSMGQIVDRLDARFDLLTAGPRGSLLRHQTLRGLTDWSYELCSPAEQGLWARMSVFEGGAELEAVESVCGVLDQPTLELLAGLVDKSIVTVSQTDGRVRFRMLETIRQYGAERLAERAETEVVRNRHLDYFLAVSRESRAAWFGPSQLELLARTTADLGNLRVAFDHALSRPGEPTAALELASAVAWYWQAAGALDEGARWFARALGDQHADAEAASHVLLRALCDAVNLCSQRNDVEGGLAIGRRAVSLPAPEPTPADRGARHLARTHLATVTGDYELAVAEHHRALVEFQAAGDMLRQVEALYNIAVLTDVLDRPTEAAIFLEEAMRLCDAVDERFVRRDALEFYGVLQGKLGRYEAGLAAMRASLTAWPVLYPVQAANAFYSIAKIHAVTDEKSRAAVLLGVRVRIWDEFGFAISPFATEGGFDVFGNQLSKAIGETAFRSAYDEGYAMSLEEAVQFALGAETSPPVARPAAGASQLSKRENQVAELVARGLSNKDIAQELVISQRTVEGHVAKIMDKLGVSSRAQVAVWVTEESGAQE